MDFFFDHDVPRQMADPLHAAGHQITLLREVLPVETPDEEVFAWARDHGLVTVTCNRDDFLPFAQQTPHPGIVILVRRQSRALEKAALLRLLERAGEDGIANNVNFA